MTLSSQPTRADVALQVLEYHKVFGDRVLFDHARLEISCGERLALGGPNGCGKTTLLRDIVTTASWDHPVLRVGPSLRVGYCAYNQEVFDPAATVLDTFIELGLRNRQEVLEALRGYLFTWDDLDKQIVGLSGGEKNRLQFAALLVQQATFLILDEPTNHIDIPSRESIEDALAEFAGTVLVVSHDRYLLDKMATGVVEVIDGGLRRHPGGFSEYWAQRPRGATGGSPATPRATTSGGGNPASPLGTLESRIEAAEARRAHCERRWLRPWRPGKPRRRGAGPGTCAKPHSRWSDSTRSGPPSRALGR